MGWTWYNATNYKNGKIDRKAECDKLFTDEHYKVLKSCMKGSVWYAAVEYHKEEKRIVFAAIVLTKTCDRNFEYYNFGYKDMDETMGPFRYDCPKSIIDLLTPTDNECANEWRRKCLEKEETTIQKLNKLPIGTKIKITWYDGTVETYYKHTAAYQFKRPFWMACASYRYISPKRIPDNFEIITE